MQGNIVIKSTVLLVLLACSVFLGHLAADRRFDAWKASDTTLMDTQAEVQAEYDEAMVHAKKEHGTRAFQRRFRIREIDDAMSSRKGEMENWSMTGAGKTYAVPRGCVGMLRLKVMDDDRRLTDEAAALLRLTWEEREKADAAIWRAWVAITHEEAKHVTVEINKPDHVKFSIGAFRREGQKIKNDLMRELTEILGEDRVDFLFNKNSFHFSFRDQHFLVFGEHSNFVELRKYGKRSWSCGTLGIGFRGIQSDLVGRFFDKLPPEAQKRVKTRFRGLPTLRETGEMKK